MNSDVGHNGAVVCYVTGFDHRISIQGGGRPAVPLLAEGLATGKNPGHPGPLGVIWDSGAGV